MLIIPSLIEELERKFKITEYQVGDRVRITKYKNILLKVTLKTGQEKYLKSNQN